MQHVEVFHTGFEFGIALWAFCGSRRGEQFQLDAEAVLEGFFKLLAQHRGGRPAGDDFAFLLGRFDDLFPFIRGIGCVNPVDENHRCNEERINHIET